MFAPPCQFRLSLTVPESLEDTHSMPHSVNNSERKLIICLPWSDCFRNEVKTHENQKIN